MYMFSMGVIIPFPIISRWVSTVPSVWIISAFLFFHLIYSGVAFGVALEWSAFAILMPRFVNDEIAATPAIAAEPVKKTFC